jgi:excisionase family DNA binding protein
VDPNPIVDPKEAAFYLSVCQAARTLGVSPQAVRRRISRGQLPAVRDRVSRRYRIPREAVLAQLEGVAPPAGLAKPVALTPPDPRTAEVLARLGLLCYVRSPSGGGG